MRIEIAFFRGGTTRTAWDQSISSDAASESSRTAAAISLSVKDAIRAQSVLPFRGSCLETTVIFLPLISARSPHRYPSATVSLDRAHGWRQLRPLRHQNYLPLFTTVIMPVRFFLH